MVVPETVLNYAPYLNKVSVAEWRHMVKSWRAYAAMCRDPIAIFDLVSNEVLETFKCRSPMLGSFLQVVDEPMDEHDPDRETEWNEEFIDLINKMFQPLDELEAIEWLKKLNCPESGNLVENMADYVLKFKETCSYFGELQPQAKQLVEAFVAGVRYQVLRERIGAKKKSKDLEETMKVAFELALEAEKGRREAQRQSVESKGEKTKKKHEDKASTKCPYCNKVGHDATKCWKKQRDERKKGVKTQACFSLSSSSLVAQGTAKRPEAVVCVDGRDVNTLLDTGADADFVDKTLIDELGFADEIIPTNVKVRLQGGTVYNVHEKIEVNIDLGVIPKTGRRTTAKLVLYILPRLKPQIVFGFPTLTALGLVEIHLPTAGEGTKTFLELEGDEFDEEVYLSSAQKTNDAKPVIMDLTVEVEEVLAKLGGLFGGIDEPADVEPFGLDLRHDRVVNVPPYRYGEGEVEEMKRQVEELCNMAVIRRSESQYNNPVVLAWKRDRTRRMCLDFRRLNEITTDLTHPLPLIDDLVERLQGNSYFAALDLSKAFLQIPLKHECQDMTAFIVDGVKYCYTRMPFGLKNAAAYCQRALEAALGSSVYTDCLVYVDDVVVYGRDKTEFLRRLETVLGKLHTRGLRLNAKKCIFAASEIDYLGWTVSADGKRIAEDRLQGIHDLAPPVTCRRFVRSWGLLTTSAP
ncbi:hypothetical protein J8273_4090 [Carpediemonas membranifera]|uniref:Reverse transcriptase domain-containing protein n=1 Tax=Carpediemonas membranifera TaxID=201153 RepID=A0A8J6ATT9_9EUKA|nr:hypothetical protein J8273_4090 [Carpediemonas membranifera]|eukprot:KAG9394426.1 hypothetical protein J8273_4090 [Carpediemonas membranifera]